MFWQRYKHNAQFWKLVVNFALLLWLSALSKMKREAVFTGLKILRKIISSNFGMEAVQQHLRGQKRIICTCSKGAQKIPYQIFLSKFQSWFSHSKCSFLPTRKPEKFKILSNSASFFTAAPRPWNFFPPWIRNTNKACLYSKLRVPPNLPANYRVKRVSSKRVPLQRISFSRHRCVEKRLGIFYVQWFQEGRLTAKYRTHFIYNQH